MKRSCSLALGIIALVWLAAGSACAQTEKCQAAKMKAAGKKAGCLLGVRSKVAAKAVLLDTAKLMKCETKFSGAFTKAESKPPCSTTADASAIESKVDRFAKEIAADLTLSPPSKCQGGKLKAAGKAAKCRLAAEGKALVKSLPIDLSKCDTKFSAAWTTAESQGDCGPATGDMAAIAAKLAALEDDVACEEDAGPACACGTPAPARLAFTTSLGSGNCGSTVSSTGSLVATLGCNNLFTGGGTSGTGATQIPDYGTTITKTSCCRSKFLSLSAASSTDTGSNRNCSDANCLYGPPQPIPSSIPPVCVINTVAQPAGGYMYCDAGSQTLDIPLASNVHVQFDLFPATGGMDHCVGGDNSGAVCTDNTPCTGGGFCSAGLQACPICAGDGKCHGGANDGGLCTPGSLLVMGPQYPTSHDCPPGGESPLAGSLAIPYLLTTGTVTKTAVDEPMGQPRVFCGFCSDPSSATFMEPAVPCTSDGECAGFTTGCGGAGMDPCTACKQRSPGAFAAGSARTITETGVPAGAIATGDPPKSQTLATVFCIPPTFSAVDGSGDLPGPGATALQGQVQLLP